jgi:hypothetical protein
MANIIDTIINRHFIREPSKNWNIVVTAAMGSWRRHWRPEPGTHALAEQCS